jgi:hypothetical protein
MEATIGAAKFARYLQRNVLRERTGRKAVRRYISAA